MGIQEWKVVQANEPYILENPLGAAVLAKYLAQYPERSSLNSYYIIKMQIAIENIGNANVLFKDPQLEVYIEQPKMPGAEVKRVATAEEVKEMEIREGKRTTNTYLMTTNFPTLEAKRIYLGTAGLVREGELWENVINIQAPEDGQKAKETKKWFEVVVGRRDLEHAQLMIDAFNAMNEQDRRWQMKISGTAKVGWSGKDKGETSSMIFSSAPVEFELKSKPTFPQEIIFSR